MQRALIGFALIIAFAAAGCVVPLKNVKDAPVTMASDTTPTLEAIGKAVIRAGGAQGWKMEKVKPGHMVGTMFLRSHMAKVDITFNKDAYNITYKESSNLDYNGTEIHKDYNGWISELDRAINREFSLM